MANKDRMIKNHINSATNIIYIYALIDPKEINENHIYIGKSNNPYYRFYQHIHDQDGTHKVHWIKSLLKLGYNPELQILEQCNFENWEEREKDWIKFYKNIKWLVVNQTDGGEDPPSWKNRSHTIKHNISIGLSNKGKTSWVKGKHQSKEHIEKRRIANIGKCRSKEVREKISKTSKGRISGMKGKHHSQESIQKIIINHKGQVPWNKGKIGVYSIETLQKMSHSHKK
jgi:hypothetical protein